MKTLVRNNVILLRRVGDWADTLDLLFRYVMHKPLLKCCLPLGINRTCELCNCFSAMLSGSTLLRHGGMRHTSLSLGTHQHECKQVTRRPLGCVLKRWCSKNTPSGSTLSTVPFTTPLAEFGVSGVFYFKLMCLRTVWSGACSVLQVFSLHMCTYFHLQLSACWFLVCFDFFFLACVFIYSTLRACVPFPSPLHQLCSSTGIACFVQGQFRKHISCLHTAQRKSCMPSQFP